MNAKYPRILVIDDSKPMRVFTKTMLETMSAAVDCAESGAEALALVKKGANYALALIDLEMPDVGGCDIARALRAAGERMPLIAVSGHPRAEMAPLCQASGFDAYLEKPFTPVSLQTAVVPWLKESSRFLGGKREPGG